MLYIANFFHKVVTGFSKAYSIKERTQSLTQEMVDYKLEVLQQEANTLARKYSWPKGNNPTFKVIYCKKATGAFINLQTLVITLTTKHLKLPISYVRFTLAHEIAHHYQEVTGNMPTYKDALWYRKSIILGLGLSFLYISQYTLAILLSGNSLLDKLIIFTSMMLYTVISYILARAILIKAQEQLIEVDADTKAIEILRETQPAIDYFSMNQKQDYEKLLVCTKKISKFLDFFQITSEDKKNLINTFWFKSIISFINSAVTCWWFIKDRYIALFSTHPTDTRRVKNLTKLAHN